MTNVPNVPMTGTPTSLGVPSTAVTVLVSPVSTSVSFVSRLPAAVGSPGNSVLALLTPLSITRSLPLASSTATGASLVPVMLITTAAPEVTPLASAMV